MASIGFVPAEEKPRPSIQAGDLLLRFDSGAGISLESAMRHVLAVGISGGGKTTCVIIPAMKAAIESGAMTVIIDPKGTLGGYARAIADACGRGGDVVEFGTSPSGRPLNIIENMTRAGFFRFLMGLLDDFFDGGKSGNMDFHASSASMARDVFAMLKEADKVLRKTGEAIPTIPLVLQLMSDPETATRIFTQLLKTAELTPELRRFAKRIENSVFHVLNQTETDTDSDHQRQMSFNTLASIQALTQFLEEDGITGKFCAPGAPGLDFSEFGGKIVLLRFGAGSGGAATEICRMTIEAFYSWVYRTGVGGLRKFLIVDEYQEVADLSSRRGSDVSFLAMAREYRCGVIVATQSYAALAARYGMAGLEALVANISNKVFLRSEDPMTREAAGALGAPDLISLQKCAFAATFDAEARTFAYGGETLEDSHRITGSITPVEGSRVSFDVSKQSAEGVLKALEKAETGKNRGKTETRTMKPGASAPDPGGNFIKGPGGMQISEDFARRHGMDDDYENYFGSTYSDCDEMEEAARDMLRKPEREGRGKGMDERLDADDVRLANRNLFKRNAEISIPRGWVPFMARIAGFFSTLGLPASIESIQISSSGKLEASGSPRGTIKYLNRLLAMSDHFCIRCGREIEPNPLNICDECLMCLPVREKGEKEECSLNW